MARQSSIRLLSGAGDRRFDDLVRLVVATLVVVVGMAVIGLPIGSRPSSWTAFWSTVTASTRWQPSDAQVGSQLLDPAEASRANDDGYLEGFTKALGDDL
jgi:hypothetical protein